MMTLRKQLYSPVSLRSPGVARLGTAAGPAGWAGAGSGHASPAAPSLMPRCCRMIRLEKS
jgi:hypothetical protein